MHTKTRIFPSLSQVLVLFQLGKTRWIARERSCLCRFSYKHRNVFSFQLFHGIGPAACLDKPFLIALIQAKETQHLHRLVCFRLACVFSSFPCRKKGDACVCPGSESFPSFRAWFRIDLWCFLSMWKWICFGGSLRYHTLVLAISPSTLGFFLKWYLISDKKN